MARLTGPLAYREHMNGPGDQTRRGWLARLAPRPRLLLAVVAVAVAIAAGTTVSVLAAGSGHRPPHSLAGSATAGRRVLGAGSSAAPAPRRPGPVLLIPGYGGGTGSLDSLAVRIRATGRVATVLHLPGSGTGNLRVDAVSLNAAVRAALAHGAPSVDIVGYSAGGVVALIWARSYDGTTSARRIITLGAPFHGTGLAAAAEAFLPRECPVACQQLVPGSALLRSLRVGSPSGLPPWLSLWTTDDAVVTPPTSARLAGAVDVPIQSVCPAAAIAHTQLPGSPVVAAMVLQALGTGPLRAPTRAACG